MPERNAVKILITVVAVAATLQLAATPFFGDDLAYLGVFSGPNAHCDSFFDWLLNGARHWLNVNGRLANIEDIFEKIRREGITSKLMTIPTKSQAKIPLTFSNFFTIFAANTK